MKNQKHSNKLSMYRLENYRILGTTNLEFLKIEIMYMKMAVDGYTLE